MKDEILRFEAVALAAPGAPGEGIEDISLRLGPGEVAVVLVPEPAGRVLLLDAAAGLLAPQRGTVRFMGSGWHDLTPSAAAARRGRIGWFFSDARAWVSNLSVRENVLLAQRHRGEASDRELEQRAEGLAEALGLAGLPSSRPPWTDAALLARLQWVRALLGRPELLLLESPTHATSAARAEWLEALERGVQEGAAALWVTGEPEVWQNPGREVQHRFCVESQRWRSDSGSRQAPYHG